MVQAAGRRTEVLRLLRDVGRPMGIGEIAGRLAIHPNTARFHLDKLVGLGQVERSTGGSGTPGRPPQLFQTVRGMDPMGPRHYRMLAEVLAASLGGDSDAGRRSLEAGRAWGRLQASFVASRSSVADTAEIPDSNEQVDATGSVGRLMGVLDELGFSPQRYEGGDGSQIGLRSCPFLELAVDRPEIICPVHLGLMQGAMEFWDTKVTVGRLVPFVEPDLCVAHLSTTDVS